MERGRPAAVTSPRVRLVTGDRIWSRFGVSVGRNESGRWRGENDLGRWVVGESKGGKGERANDFRARTTFYETLSSPDRVRENKRVMLMSRA